MFKSLPKTIVLAIFLIKSLDLREGLSLVQELNYLWREFNIRVRIIPKIEYFTVCFSYKDKQLKQIKTDRLKDIIKISEEIKKQRCEKEGDFIVNIFHKSKHCLSAPMKVNFCKYIKKITESFFIISLKS